MFKKKPQKTKEHDLLALDQAVTELSRQTEALLGAGGNTKPKPQLPKKQSRITHKGKSFDIIHDPKKSRRIQATLKASKPASKTVTHKEPELLPEHVTQGLDKPHNPTSTKATLSVFETTEPPIIKGQHEAGSLIDKEALKVLDEGDQPTDLSPTKEQSVQTKTSSATHDLPVAQTSISFTEDEQTGVADPQATPPADLAPEADGMLLASQDETESNTTSYTGELYANNLVKEIEPKGFKPTENGEGPAVFDTEQYHPDLHDWSKLESRHTNLWLFALLVVVVIGAAVYFVLSGQKLPF